MFLPGARKRRRRDNPYGRRKASGATTNKTNDKGQPYAQGGTTAKSETAMSYKKKQCGRQVNFQHNHEQTQNRKELRAVYTYTRYRGILGLLKGRNLARESEHTEGKQLSAVHTKVVRSER